MNHVRRFDAPLHRVITLTGSGVFPILGVARIRNPSDRLRLSLRAFYEFQGTPVINYGTITDHNTEWRIRGRDPGTGSLGQPFLEDMVGIADPPGLRDLPNTFEIQTGVEQIQVDITQTDFVESGATTIGIGNWYVRASWEAANDSIPQGELEKLFGMCGIFGDLTLQP